MKLASVTFSGRPDQVGGAQIPAKAFQKWCKIFNIECDYLIWENTTPFELNNYDGIFFCTVPTDDQVVDINVPYICMIHAEFDIPTNAIHKAISLVVIQKDYWGYPNELPWYPCVFPEYLLKGDEIWSTNKSGLLYSARITTWKNATLLAGLTRYKPFLDFYGPVYISGKANHDHYQESIDLIDPNWTIISGLFDINHFGKVRAKHYEKSTYWEVFGTPKNRIQIPRFNLSAVEAMKFGLVPIVDKRSTPNHTNIYTIDINDIGDYHRINDYRKRMMEILPNSPYGYDAVYKQIQNILEVFSNECNNI